MRLYSCGFWCEQNGPTDVYFRNKAKALKWARETAREGGSEIPVTVAKHEFKLTKKEIVQLLNGANLGEKIAEFEIKDDWEVDDDA